MYPPFPASWQIAASPCNTVPPPSLKFRTSGFPQYGFKLEFNQNGSLPYDLVWAGIERLPNLLRVSFPSVPPSVPRWTERLHMAVPSPFALAFALFVEARHPQPTHAGSRVGRVTRLQSSLYATARKVR